ncbi:MAG: hypothetical protein NVSMB57_13890 [Actinomycetota bacterium]
MRSAIAFARTRVSRLYLLPAATLILAGGVIHLKLFATYRSLPVVGAMFLGNVIASGLIAIALVSRREAGVALLAVGLSVSSLIALTLSRTVGLFGFMEGMTPQSTAAAASEVAALAVLMLAITAGRIRTPERASH